MHNFHNWPAEVQYSHNIEYQECGYVACDSVLVWYLSIKSQKVTSSDIIFSTSQLILIVF